MKPLHLAAAAAAMAVTLAAMPAPAQDANRPLAELPVESVTLYTSGVGFFGHAGIVPAGDASATLRFEADQIDDLLKSLVFRDAGGGNVSAVTYGAAGPLDRQLGSFEIDLSGTPTILDLLRQLQGARVTLSATGREISGTIVSVETRQVAAGEATVERGFVTVFGDTGLVNVAVEEVTSFEIQDEKLRNELAAALSALASSREKDKRPVTIDFAGDAEREVRLGYVVETPVWKTSYRLSLASGDEASLQGWAIVENQTDFDWEGVSLGLVSGRPISFEMALSEPLYADRPTVEVPRPPAVRPKAYAGGVEADREEQALGRAVRSAPSAAPMEAMDMRREAGGFGGGGFTLAESAATSTSDRGALFEYRVPSVTIARQTSAMIPVVAEPVTAEPVSLYDQQQGGAHPFNAALLTNNTGKHLPAGPVTVYDAEGYAGEGQLTDAPADQDRLVTFGVDLELTVTTDTGGGRGEVVGGSISEGVLRLQRRLVSETTYRFQNDADAAKTVIVQQMVPDGFEVVSEAKPYETTPAGEARFRVEVEPGTGELVVRLSRVVAEEIALLDDRRFDRLFALARGGELPADLRDAVVAAAELRREVARAEQRIASVEQQLKAIDDEQSRIRQNMERVDRQSDYYKRLLAKLDEQETQIEQLRGRLDELRKERDTAQRQLRDYVQGLDVG